VGDRLRVRSWVGRVVPFPLQAFNAAFQGHEIIGTVAWITTKAPTTIRRSPNPNHTFVTG